MIKLLLLSTQELHMDEFVMMVVNKKKDELLKVLKNRKPKTNEEFMTYYSYFQKIIRDEMILMTKEGSEGFIPQFIIEKGVKYSKATQGIIDDERCVIYANDKEEHDKDLVEHFLDTVNTHFAVFALNTILKQ